MNRKKAPLSFLLGSIAFAIASCTSISQEQLTAHEKTRLEQERKRYFDRESGAQQRAHDQRAVQENLQRRN